MKIDQSPKPIATDLYAPVIPTTKKEKVTPASVDRFLAAPPPGGPGDICVGYRASVSVVAATRGRDEYETPRGDVRERDGVFVTLSVDGQVQEPIFIPQHGTLTLVKTDNGAGQVSLDCRADLSEIDLSIWGAEGADSISVGQRFKFGVLEINGRGGEDAIAVAARADGQKLVLFVDGRDRVALGEGGNYRTEIGPCDERHGTPPAFTPIASGHEFRLRRIQTSIANLRNRAIAQGIELKNRGGNFFVKIERNSFESGMVKMFLLCSQWDGCGDKTALFEEHAQGSPYAESYGEDAKVILESIDRARIPQREKASFYLELTRLFSDAKLAVLTGRAPSPTGTGSTPRPSQPQPPANPRGPRR